jgi:hypothetical protein
MVGMNPLLDDPDVRVDVFTGDGCTVRLAHTPTGLTATASNPQVGQIRLMEAAAAELDRFLSR